MTRQLTILEERRRLVNRFCPVRKWRFEDLLTFAEVMETGSVTAAAARLDLSKSVVSKRIQDLESALAVELFKRSTRQVKPTEKGETLYEQIVPLIHDFHDTVRQFSHPSDTLQGRLRIVVPISVGTNYLRDAIARFAECHPELELAIDYYDHSVDLVKNGYDLAVRIGVLSDSRLISRKLFECRRIVCCSPAYVREKGLPTRIADLADHVCIDHSSLHNKQIWEFSEGADGKTRSSVPVRGRVVANSDEAMRDMAIAGFGLILLPFFVVADALDNGDLIAAQLDEQPTSHAISAVYPATRHVSSKVRAFIDHLVAHFRHHRVRETDPS